MALCYICIKLVDRESLFEMSLNGSDLSMDSPLTSLRQNGLVVARRQRYDEDAWQGARSWLGGLPHIRLEEWPRHSLTRAPLFHLAQINFADLPAGPWSSYLPQSGALCFFYDVDTNEAHESLTAVYVPDPDHSGPCQPPDDCPPLGGAGNWHREPVNRDRTRIEDANRVMPRWPVEFMPVKCEAAFSEDEGRQVHFDPSLETLLGPDPDYVLTPPPANGPRRAQVCLTSEIPWEAARRVVVAVQNSARFNPARDLEPGIAAKLKDIAGGARRRQEAERAFLDQWQPLIAQNDPYALMSEDQVQSFIDTIWTLRRSKTLSPRIGYRATNLDEAGGNVYLEMLLGSRDMYEKIPSQVRDRIHNEWRQCLYDGTHQIFGQGRDPQGYLEQFDDHLMLLELNFDPMMNWDWGDLGLIQFFITPEDLAARNWNGIKATYTCG
jgi:uncharacterized protein YwqG